MTQSMFEQTPITGEPKYEFDWHIFVQFHYPLFGVSDVFFAMCLNSCMSNMTLDIWLLRHTAKKTPGAPFANMD